MKKIFITLSLILLSGCTYFESDHDNYWLNNVRFYKTREIKYYDPTDGAMDEKLTYSTTRNAHNYEKNVIVSANLGQRMVDSKTYSVKNYTKNKIVANMDGELYTINNAVKIKKGDVYEPIGEVKINGNYFMIINPNNDGSLLLVDENGKFLDMICYFYKGDLLMPETKALVTPKGLGIDMDKDVREDVTEPKLQFEIKYDGIENDQVAFIYVDYSNATSSEGYFNRYVFPKENDLIEINGVKFKIMDAYPDRIEYMILD